MPVDNALATENYERYCYARDNGHLDYVEKADKCERYFAGQQWDEVLRRRLERQGKPVLTINKTLATLASVMGEQIETRADIAFRPFRNGNEQTAEALSKVYLQISNANKLDWLESEVGADGFITSRGFYDVRVSFGDQMRGEVQIGLLNPKNVVIDPDAEEYDPDKWKEVFITKWLSPNDISVTYNQKDAKILARKTKSSFMLGYDSIDQERTTFGGKRRFGTVDTKDKVRRLIRTIERQYKDVRNQEHFVDPQTGDMRPIPENWDHERIGLVLKNYDLRTTKKNVEQIRWLVTADEVVLFDSWSPYKYFTIVPYFPYFRRGNTIGLVENLISPQDQLNKSSSQELHVINTTANSGWKLKKGSLSNMDPDELEQRGAETGLVLELEDVNDAEKIQPNQIPTGLDRVSFKSDEAIKEISGVSDSKRGFDRADVAAKAIKAKQAAGSVNLAKPLDNLARTRHLLAERVLNLVQTYYTEERVEQIAGRGVGAEMEEIVINQVTPEGDVVNDLTVGEYTVVVTTVPARDSYMQSQFDEALQMREIGIAIPDEFLVENSHLNRKAELVKRLKELSGGGEPSETQMQLAQLEVQEKQVEIEERQANAILKQMNAQLAKARAENTAQETEEAMTPELALQREKTQAELHLQAEKLKAEIMLKREQLQAEIALKREQMRMDSMLKRAEAAERLDQQEKKVAANG